MKKLYLIGLALITAMLMTLPSIAQANLLSNPGFEDSTGEYAADADYWFRGGSGVNRETWAARTGDAGVAFHGWATDLSGYIYQDVTGTAGTPYTFSIWAMKEATYASDGVVLKLEWLDDLFASTGTADEVNIVSTLTTGWLQYSVSGTAPADTTIVRAVLAGNNFTAGGAAKFDDADVSAVPEPAPLLLLSGGLVGLFSVVRKKK